MGLCHQATRTTWSKRTCRRTTDHHPMADPQPLMGARTPIDRPSKYSRPLVFSILGRSRLILWWVIYSTVYRRPQGLELPLILETRSNRALSLNYKTKIMLIT